MGLYYFINKRATAPVAVTEKKEPVVADTFIPKGYVLVPITIDPASQISGLIDQFALVDLYASNALIATSVKLIRAPLNPQQFAVLVTENLSREIMKVATPFWVTLQNRNNRSQPPSSPSQPAAPEPPAVPIAKEPVKIEYYKGI